MPYDFDKVIDRSNTNSYKWDKFPKDTLPMWVADMDFESPPEIKAALQKLIDHNIFGYSRPPQELYEVVMERLENLHSWKVQKEWIVFLPGLVPGIHTSARVLGEDFSAVMTSTPVYYPFLQAADMGPRRLQGVSFVKNGKRWEMDFEKMKNTVTPDTKMYMLCNPHNPNGRVFDKKELENLAEMSLQNNLLVMSDEIHCDLVLDESKKHISFATLSPEVEQNSITLLAPSKTFNIAGLGCSIAIIPNKEIRENFEGKRYGMMPMMSSFSCEAAIAAYKYGEPWRKELISYLKANHDLLCSEVNKIESLEMLSLDATYLAWIKYDGHIEEGIEKFLAKKGLGVSPGEQFDGEGFFRLNFGTQKSNVIKAIEILKNAFA